MTTTENQTVKEIVITLDGEVLHSAGNRVEYKMLFDVVDGTAGSLQRFTELLDQSGEVSFYLRPPKEKCFQIVMDAAQYIGSVAAPLLPYSNDIKDAASILFEYLKLKKSLKGKPLSREMIQTNNAGDVVVKDNAGSIVYHDNRKILNVNIVQAANDDVPLNKKIDKIAKAFGQQNSADTLSFNDKDGSMFELAKGEAGYLQYEEKVSEKPNSVTGYIRSIDNKTNKGVLTVTDEEREKGIPFEIVIADITKLESIVNALAIAEGYRTRVQLSGKLIQDQQGKLKKIVAEDVELLDKPLDFGKNSI